MMATVSTTVVEAWDKRWTTAEGRADWLDPDPHVMGLLPELKRRGARTALDLVVTVIEGLAETACEQPADGSFAGAHQADEKEIATVERHRGIVEDEARCAGRAANGGTRFARPADRLTSPT